ncbi:MAG: bifunctional oligoribonuclease/PAP phosphatase NrnA [Candidatus Aureabacteria bacterium]|nr:bifunctional oligoribonuclease/PAP phosphatase NrnA [Candidatus Auribacterota bacterium]
MHARPIPPQWDRIIPTIRSGSRFVITGHEHADGDALGSQVALYYFLKQLHKRIWAINCDEPQRRLAFIDPDRVVETYRPDRHAGVFASCDAWFIVDTTAWQRIGALGEVARAAACPTITIDHHVFNIEESFARINIVDDKAVATAKLIYQLGMALGCRLDRRIAVALYTALYTDSGGFVYTKMDAASHRIVAQLLEAGAVPYEVYDSIYQGNSAAEIELFGKALNSLRFDQHGRVAYMAITSRMYANSGADPERGENYLLNVVRSIKTVELAVLFRQLPEGEGSVKVSFRAKNFFRVNGIARDLGGGGHWYAAGAMVEGSLPRVYEKVKSVIAREWKRQSRIKPTHTE